MRSAATGSMPKNLTPEPPELFLSGVTEADAFLASDPLALLIGMVLDQQVPLEKAFHSPYELKQRMGGHLDIDEIANADPAMLAETFTKPPALHRFPGSMAKRVQQLCRHVIDNYDGKPEAIWQNVGDARELYANIKELPGFGEQKAKIFVAFLAKRLGIRPPEWQTVSAPYGEEQSLLSIADIVDEESKSKVRAYKKAMKTQLSSSRT